MKLTMIKTDKCCYIKSEGGYNCYLTNILINGKKPVATFARDWVEIDGVPKTVQKPLPVKRTNYRMELKAELLEKGGFSGTTLGKMAPSIPREECMYDDDDDGWEWKKDYSHLASLYELKYDEEEQEPEDIEFECSLFCEIPSLDAYAGFEYQTGERGYGEKKRLFYSSERIVSHRAVDSIIYPTIMMPSCESTISSDHLYKIVRFHIKQNIDYHFADITSDYDFCFTVRKRVLQCGDAASVKEKPTNRKGFRLKAHDMYDVFEMTSASQKYKGYTPLPKLQAKNAKALKRKLDKYLKDLTEFINQPVELCPSCGGKGTHHPVVKFAHPTEDVV